MRPALVLSLILLSAPAFAGPVDGTFDITLEACANDYSDARLTIADSLIQFHESQCKMANEAPVPGMATAWFYDLTCEGEGETWSERAILALTFQGANMVMLTDTYGFETVRCP